MKMITRERCVISGKCDLEHLYTFKDFPVFMGCTDKPPEEDIKADMIWCIGKSSGMIQLGELLPLNILYQAAHDAGSVGKLMKEHHRAFAQFIMNYASSKSKKYFEIGGGHGILAKECMKLGKIDWTILEPNPQDRIKESGAKYEQGFFDEKYTRNESYDAIIFSHVFEHMYDVNGFIKNVSNFLETGKYAFFSIPNLLVWLSRKYNNALNFEHTIFLTEEYADYLVLKNGLNIVGKQHFGDCHSIFYSCVKNDPAIVELDRGLYQRNKNIFEQYINYYEYLISDLNIKISSSKNPIYLFGAHIFSQYLIEFGLKTEKIAGILDNSLSKQGKRLYGTNFKVHSPSILQRIERPVVILYAGPYNNEIKNDILNNINADTVFWE